MNLYDTEFLQPKQILVRPVPKKDESWLGYLLRLSAENKYNGLGDLGRIIDHTPISMLMSNPKATLQSLGVQAGQCKMPRLSKARTSGLGSKLFATGRCRNFKVCPHCLSEDAHPYLRAEWDGPISFTCEKHRVLLLGECTQCRRRLSFDQRAFDRCECGAQYKDQIAAPIPGWFYEFMRIFSEAYSGSDAGTFRSSSEIERHASAATYWLLAPIDAATGRRTWKVNRKAKELAFSDLERLEPLLQNWPQSAIESVKMEIGKEKRKPTLLLRRRLSATHFKGMQDLARAVDSKIAEEKSFLAAAKQVAVIHTEQENFTFRDLMSLTGLTYLQLVKLAAEGRIPNIHIGRRLVGKRARSPFGIDVPSAVYLSLSQIYQETCTIAQAAVKVGCSETAMRAVTRAAIVRSYAISPEMKEHRPYVVELSNFSTGLFSHATYNDELPSQSKQKFSDWARLANLGSCSSRWGALLTRIKDHELQLFSSVPDPKRLDDLYISRLSLQGFLHETIFS